MIISAAARRLLIQEFEALRLVAYLPTPHDVPTIGWGHTDGVKLGDTCTVAQAETFLDVDLRKFEVCVNAKVTADINQNQFDALTSLCFNIGEGNFMRSTLVRKINEGYLNFASNPDKGFLAWNKQDGRVLDGLTRRRQAELDWYNK